jgi:hypothetical protein
VTEELLFPGRKVCYGDFGRDGAGPSNCRRGGEGGGCVLGDGLTLTDVGGSDESGDMYGK